MADKKSTTFNVVYLDQNEPNYKDLMFNKMVQQTSWQATCMCIFVLKTRQFGLVMHADSKLLCLPRLLLGHIGSTRSVCHIKL